MLVLLLWVIILGYYAIFKGTNMLLYTPVFVVLMTISFQFESINISDGNKGVILSNYLLMIFLIIISVIKIFRNRRLFGLIHKIGIFWILFLTFLLFVNSSEVWESFKRYLNVVATVFVMLGMMSFDFNEKDFKIALQQSLYFLIFFCINVIILSAFQLGSGFTEKLVGYTYSANFLRTGWFTTHSFHGIAIITSIIPFLMEFWQRRNYRMLAWVIMIVSTIILIVTFKRTYFIVLVIGVIFYFIFKLLIKRNNLILSFVIMTVIMGFSISSFDLFQSLILRRNKTFSTFEFMNEGRYLEFAYYPDAVKDAGISFMFFGSELFVSSGKYRALDRIQKDRFLHNDYAHLLYGSGIIGLFIYFYLFYKIYKDCKLFHNRNPNYQNKLIFYFVITIIITILLSGTGDGILTFINRVVPLYLIGVLYSALRYNASNNSTKTN